MNINFQIPVNFTKHSYIIYINVIISPLIQPVNQNPQKYKTILCKHFSSSKGCSFGDKCNFAHGVSDIRSSNGFSPQQSLPQNNLQNKKGLNAQNYKIVKCKYFEKDGSCRYGSLCTFAHGDEDLRTKSDNLMATQAQMNDIIFSNTSMRVPENPYLDEQIMMMGIPNDPNVMLGINYPMFMNMGMKMGSGTNFPIQGGQNNHLTNDEI